LRSTLGFYQYAKNNGEQFFINLSLICSFYQMALIKQPLFSQNHGPIDTAKPLYLLRLVLLFHHTL